MRKADNFDKASKIEGTQFKWIGSTNLIKKIMKNGSKPL